MSEATPRPMMEEPRMKWVLVPNEKTPERAVLYLDGREVDPEKVTVACYHGYNSRQMTRVTLSHALACMSGHADYESWMRDGKGSSPNAYYELDAPRK